MFSFILSDSFFSVVVRDSGIGSKSLFLVKDHHSFLDADLTTTAIGTNGAFPMGCRQRGSFGMRVFETTGQTLMTEKQVAAWGLTWNQKL